MKSDQEFVMDYTLNIVTDRDRNLFYQDDMLCERQPRGTDQDDGLSKVENLLQTDSPEDTSEVPILEEIEKTGTGYSNSEMDYDNVHRSMNHGELNIKDDDQDDSTTGIVMIACGSGLLLVVLTVVVVYLLRRQNRREIFKHPESKFVEL